MILTCPRCATRYLVDEGQVWTTGRTVQCDGCGQRWRATGSGVRPEAPATPAPEPASPTLEAIPKPVVVEPALPPVEQPNFTPLGPDVVVPPARPPESESLFIPVRPETRNRRTTTAFGGPVGLIVVWAIALAMAVILAIAVAERDDLVRAVPGLAAAYRAIGIPAGPSAPPPPVVR